MLRYVIAFSFVCSIVVAEDCFDDEKIKDEWTKLVDVCASQVHRGKKCGDKFASCLVVAVGYFADNKEDVDPDKYVEWISQFANSDIKPDLATDLEPCKDVYTDAAEYVECIDRTLKPKCSNAKVGLFIDTGSYLKGYNRACNFHA